jgi:hypothetical protein
VPEVNNSPPFSAEVKNEWSCPSTFCMCLQGMARENFTFLYQIVFYQCMKPLTAVYWLSNVILY